MHGPSATGSPVRAGAGLDTSEGRSLVRDRLALLGKCIFILGGGFWLALSILHFVFDPDPVVRPPRPMLSHLGAALLMAALWLGARRRDWPLRTLGLLDAVTTVVCGWLWAGLIVGVRETLFISLLASMTTLNARAVLVPSTARRTLWLSLLALAPTLAAAIWVVEPLRDPRLVTAIHAALWIGLAVACATLTSHVIYGLRQRVKEATELGQYTLEEKIGAGGMGEVWRARHRLLIRPAAIKLIRPQAPGSRPGDLELMMKRFEREARATAALQSPHTVQLYDFGVADDGTFYYVMELLKGFNLEELVERFGPLPAERAVHLLEQACASLADAHDNGVIHRDIKPANLYVTCLGQVPDFLKVLDFGLVKLEPRQPEGSPRLTGAGLTTGTPAFMAPELVTGDGEIDHRVDLYSLGCAAYWMLTGHLVFEGATSMKVMIEHARTPPTPPSRRVELPIPSALDRLVLDLLAKDPADRPASAAEVAARLAACAPAAHWTRERAAAWWRAHAPGQADNRAVAELLLSHEARPRNRLRRPDPGA